MCCTSEVINHPKYQIYLSFDLQSHLILCLWEIIWACSNSISSLVSPSKNRQLELLLVVTHLCACVCSGQGLPDDVQHISSSLVVDGARSGLPGNTAARLSHGLWRPPCHHCLRVSPGLPVHRGVELGSSDPVGCAYLADCNVWLVDGPQTFCWSALWSSPPPTALWLCVRLLREQSLPGRRGQLWVIFAFSLKLVDPLPASCSIH